MISIDDIVAAHGRIATRIHRTPMLSATRLGAPHGVELWLKCESLQKTGSFKARGALNAIELLSAESRERGVIAVSAGNHAQALAWAATAAGVKATVVMPETASAAKVEASRGYGATVVLYGASSVEAFARAREIEQERGLAFVHPFDDAGVIAGAGTVGLELVEQLPDVDVVVVPVGGGGLIAGVATAVKALRPGARVVGVEPEGAAAMRRSLDAGSPQRLESVRTIADGLTAPMAGEIPFGVVRRHVDDVVLVDDDAIGRAVPRLLASAKLLAEPGAAAALAALDAGKVKVARGERVALVISGGNVDLALVARLCAA